MYWRVTGKIRGVPLTIGWRDGVWDAPEHLVPELEAQAASRTWLTPVGPVVEPGDPAAIPRIIGSYFTEIDEAVGDVDQEIPFDPRVVY